MAFLVTTSCRLCFQFQYLYGTIHKTISKQETSKDACTLYKMYDIWIRPWRKNIALSREWKSWHFEKKVFRKGVENYKFMWETCIFFIFLFRSSDIHDFAKYLFQLYKYGIYRKQRSYLIWSETWTSCRRVRVYLIRFCSLIFIEIVE